MYGSFPLQRSVGVARWVRSAMFGALCTMQAALAGTVTGPIGGGTHGWPFGAPSAGIDLAARGYVEAEYFIEGQAVSYAKAGAWARDGRWAAVPAGQAPYRTRLLVLRPAVAAAFNGSVIVEWLNVSAGWDNPEFFAHAREALLRGGFAWVGVSAQALGVQLSPFSLKAWDPARYGTLSHPGDAYAYDIVSEVARALRAPQGGDPLGGLRAQRLIAAGHSTAANGLATT
jgi:Alpha/beta hydrolase domain